MFSDPVRMPWFARHESRKTVKTFRTKEENLTVKELGGKVALLTGGSRGLGPYIARALAREGVHVVLSARSREDLDSVARDVRTLGVNAVSVPTDVTDSSSREKLYESAKNAFGRVDILINNAGIEQISHYTRLSPETIESMIKTNLMAPMLLTRLILPEMIEQGSGHVVTMSSLGGKKGSPYSASYAATKAGLIEWTRGLREELHNTGISASVICPGFVSKAGMFAVQNKKAPGIVGETTPELVAAAVIRAIKKDVGEIIVNPGPIKPMMMLDAIHPGIGAWILRTFGVYESYRGQAIHNERQSENGSGNTTA